VSPRLDDAVPGVVEACNRPSREEEVRSLPIL
jgi:hypothetical protein